jgi:hypothetical protein
MWRKYSPWKSSISTFCDKLNTLTHCIAVTPNQIVGCELSGDWCFCSRLLAYDRFACDRLLATNRIGAGATGVRSMNQNPQNPQNPQHPGQGGQHQQGGDQHKPGQQQGGGHKPGQQTQNPGTPGKGGQHDDKR